MDAGQRRELRRINAQLEHRHNTLDAQLSERLADFSDEWLVQAASDLFWGRPLSVDVPTDWDEFVSNLAALTLCRQIRRRFDAKMLDGDA